jgi:hypothetical protein
MTSKGDANVGGGLSLEDTGAQKTREYRAKTKIVGGYNPYDAVTIARPAGKEEKKQTDLRKLSESIRHAKIEELKKKQP